MKIGILSMQKVGNFGSLLQAYSLKTILEDMGNTVHFIDIEKNDKDNELLEGKVKEYSDEKESKKNNNILYKLKKIDRYALNRLYIKNKQKRQADLFEKFRKEFLKINIEDNSKIYDICVIGSDEVFNCASSSPWGFTTQLFGNVDNAKKIITYAASCGSTKYIDLPKIVKEKIEQAFKNISAFSVRDENTKEFVSKLTEKEVSLNLDPVIVGNFDEDIEKYGLNIKLPKRYCIVYSYYNRIHNKEEIDAIKSFCRRQKLELVTIGAPQFWIKKHLVMNPFQMLYAFSKAEFVITDTFHGTIFADKYSKKFATIIRDSNCNKLSDLLIRLQIENHLAKNISDLEKIYKINNNIELNEKNNLIERKKSIDYLRKNIV